MGCGSIIRREKVYETQKMGMYFIGGIIVLRRLAYGFCICPAARRSGRIGSGCYSRKQTGRRYAGRKRTGRYTGSRRTVRNCAGREQQGF